MKKFFLPSPARKDGKSTQRTTEQCHQAKDENIVLEAERVDTVGALLCLPFKMLLVAKKHRDTHFLSN
jgi:hypothetical protein